MISPSRLLSPVLSLRPDRAGSALARIAGGCLLALVLLGAGLPARAQAPAQAPRLELTQPSTMTPDEIKELRRAKQQLFLYHFGNRYILDVLVGGVLGGGLAAAIQAGPVMIISGSVLGSFLGALWFMDRFSTEYSARFGAH